MKRERPLQPKNPSDAPRRRRATGETELHTNPVSSRTNPRSRPGERATRRRLDRTAGTSDSRPPRRAIDSVSSSRGAPRRRTATPPPRRSVAGLDLGPRRPPISATGVAARYGATSPTARAARADARWGGYRTSAASGDRFPRRTWLIALTALVVLLGAGVAWHAQIAEVPFWSVQKIDVRGNRVVSSDQIAALSGIEVGTPWWSAVFSLGRHRWDELPRVQSARLRLAGWGTLAVDVTERTPVLRWVGPNPGGIAEDGTRLEFVNQVDAFDLPCLSGAAEMDPGSLTAFAGTRWYSALMELRRESPDLWRGVSQIEIENARRLRVFFRDARRVILWDPYINEHLWEQVPGILQDLAARGVDRDAVLDLRFRDRVVVRIPEELWYERWEGESPDGASGEQTVAEGARA